MPSSDEDDHPHYTIVKRRRRSRKRQPIKRYRKVVVEMSSADEGSDKLGLPVYATERRQLEGESSESD